MPPLDPKDETIVAAYISNGGNQTEAWRAGNPKSKAKPQTVHVEASKFFRQPKVRLQASFRQMLRSPLNCNGEVARAA
jgi:hypothetical protein